MNLSPSNSEGNSVNVQVTCGVSGGDFGAARVAPPAGPGAAASAGPGRCGFLVASP